MPRIKNIPAIYDDRANTLWEKVDNNFDIDTKKAL